MAGFWIRRAAGGPLSRGGAAAGGPGARAGAERYTPAVSEPSARPSPPSDPPPRTGRWRRRLLVGAAVLAVLGVVGVLARNALLRAGMEAAVGAATGFPLEVASVDLGLLDARLEVRGLHLRNPEGFGEPTCLRVPGMVADPRLRSLLGERIHLEELSVDVAEVVVVRRADGETNLDRLRALGGGKKGSDGGGGGGTSDGGSGSGSGAGGGRKFRIDLLRLGIGKVRMIDHSAMRDGKPTERTWDLGIREEFRDLDSPEQVVRVIVLRVLQRTNIRLLAASLEDVAGGLGGVVTGAGERIGSLVKGLGGDGSGGVGDRLKDAKDALGGLLGR